MFKSQISTILRLDAQSRKYFRGVYAIDELNSSHVAINEQPNDQLWLTTTTTATATASDAAVRSGTAGGGAFVVNYDESNKPGSHWVGVFRDEQGHVDFFDSTGLPPLDDRLRCFLLGPNYSYNPNQYQQILGNACGFYVVYFILQRSRHRKADDILEQLSACGVDSDYFVKDYVYTRYKPIFN